MVSVCHTNEGNEFDGSIKSFMSAYVGNETTQETVRTGRITFLRNMFVFNEISFLRNISLVIRANIYIMFRVRNMPSGDIL